MFTREILENLDLNWTTQEVARGYDQDNTINPFDNKVSELNPMCTFGKVKLNL